MVRRAGVLAVLADGMGGLAMGKEGSDCAVKATNNNCIGKIFLKQAGFTVNDFQPLIRPTAIIAKRAHNRRKSVLCSLIT